MSSDLVTVSAVANVRRSNRTAVGGERARMEVQRPYLGRATWPARTYLGGTANLQRFRVAATLGTWDANADHVSRPACFCNRSVIIRLPPLINVDGYTPLSSIRLCRICPYALYGLRLG